LAVQGKFHHYCAEFGLGEPESACWNSPFDYGKQAVLYVPLGMPEPNAYGTTPRQSWTAAWPAVIGGQGRWRFFLCTSLRAMRRTHELIKAQAGRRRPRNAAC
jgi:ATP-dependent DNA helicase DinG